MHVKIFKGTEEDGDLVTETDMPSIFTFYGLIMHLKNFYLYGKFVIKTINDDYRNRSNFHGTNISRIPKMDSISNFIFTNPPLYNIHEFVFTLIKFDGAWHLQGFRLSSVRAGTKLCLVHLKET